MKSLEVRPQWVFYFSTKLCQLPGRILDVYMKESSRHPREQ
jgi:hypothetical protein